MKSGRTAVVLSSLAVVALAGSLAWATLPSERLGSGFFGNVSRGSQYSGAAGSAAPIGPLAARFNVSPGRLGTAYGPAAFDFSDLRANLRGLRLRTLESFAMYKRARFAGLQKMSLELAGTLGGGVAGSLDVRRSFFHFIFPFGLRDKSAEHGYGFFCLGCLNRGLIKDPEGFLAEFSAEAQETIAEERFKSAVASMYHDGRLPEGQDLDQFYDSQLAAMGNYLFSTRRYMAASRVWQLLAKRDPASSLYAQAAGVSLLANQKFPEASDELRRSLQRATGWGTPDFRLRGANLQNIFTDPGDLAGARMALEDHIKNEPGNEKLQFLMAYVDVFHGLWDRARTRLETLAADDPEARELLAALKAGRIDDSIYRPFVKDDLLTAGDVAEMSADVLLTAAERKIILKSISAPKSYADYMGRGDFYFFLGNYSRASEAYDTAARIKPDEAVVKFAQVHVAFASGEFSYAVRKLRQALKAEPNWGLFNFRIEEFFGDRADLDKRIQDLEHLVKIEPKDVDAKFLLGYVYYFEGRYTESAKLLGEAVKGKPENQVADKLLTFAQLQG